MPRTETARTNEATSQSDSEAMASLLTQNAAAMSAFTEATQNMLRGAMAFNNEVMSFATKRLQQNFETGLSLTSCHDAGEACRLQVEYGHSAAEQYLEEANRIMSLATEVARDSWAPIESQAQATVETMTKQTS